MEIFNKNVSVLGGLTVSPNHYENEDGKFLVIDGTNVVSYRTAAEVLIDTSPDPQVLSISGQILTLSDGGGSVIIPEYDDSIVLAHVSSDGSDHGFIDQDVTISSSPTFSNVYSDNQAVQNNQLVRLDQLNSIVSGLNWQKSVLDITDLTQSLSSSPTSGDRYINTSSGTSPITGLSVFEDYIYEWDGSEWIEFKPDEGWTIWVEDVDQNYTYNGSEWVEFGTTVSHNNLTGLQGGSPGDYFHLDSSQHSSINTGISDSIATPSSTVINNINLSDGVVQSFTTRTLTLDDLGYTGDSDANKITDNIQIENGRGYITSYVNTQRSDEEIRDIASAQWINGTNTTIVKDDASNTLKINSLDTIYTHPTYSTSNLNTSGSLIIDYINTNNTGHITAMGTRTLTLDDLGYQDQDLSGYAKLSGGNTFSGNQIFSGDIELINDSPFLDLRATGEGIATIRFCDNEDDSNQHATITYNTSSSNALDFKVDSSDVLLKIDTSQSTFYHNVQITDGSSSLKLKYYGLEFDRNTNYLRPLTNGDKDLFIGGNSKGVLDWDVVKVYTSSTNDFTWNNEIISTQDWVVSQGYTDNVGTTTASNTQTFTNKSGNISQWTNDSGYVTSSGNTTIGTDSDINTSGAQVIDTLVMTDGVITSHSLRDLTLANLGFTGDTDANRITNNNQITNGAGYITSAGNTQLSKEQVEDFVGGMVTGNVETNISVTYNDSTGKLNFASVNTQLSNSEVTAITNPLYLGKTAKAADSDKLDSQNGTYYLDYNNFSNTPNLGVYAELNGGNNFSGNQNISGVVNMRYASGITGTSTGDANQSYLEFNESDKTTRQGFIGFGSTATSNFFISNEVSGKSLQLKGDGILTYDGDVEFSGVLNVKNSTANSEYASIGSGSTTSRHLKFSGFVANGTNNVGHRLSSLNAIALNVNGSDALYVDRDQKTTFSGVVDISNINGGKLNLINTDTTLVENQLIGELTFEKTDASGGGVGVVGGVRMKSANTTGASSKLEFSVANTVTKDLVQLTIDSDKSTFSGGVVSNGLRANNSGESTLKLNTTTSNTFSRMMLSSGGITYIQAGKPSSGESSDGGVMILSGYFGSDLEKLEVRGNAEFSGDVEASDFIGTWNGKSSTSLSTVSTVVERNSNGDISARLFRSEYDTTNPTVNFIMTQIDTATNNYIRPTTPAQFRAAVTDSYYLTSSDLSPYAKLSGGNNFSGNNQFSATNTNGSYSTAAVEIREVGLVANTESADEYAPSIGFHWGGRQGKKLFMDSAGVLNYTDGSDSAVKSDVHFGGGTFSGNIEAVSGAFTNSITVGNTSSANINLLRASSNYINATNVNGQLVFRTGGTNTALTLSSSQKATFSGDVEVGGNLSLGGTSNGYFFSDSAGRTAFKGGDFYIQADVNNCYLYATNTYLGNASGDNIRFRGNTITGNNWGIAPNGDSSFNNVLTSGFVETNKINTSFGTELVLNAGEAFSYATGQTAENIYLNAEGGVRIISSSDNWATGWAGRNELTLGLPDASSIFPGDISTPTNINVVSGKGFVNSGPWTRNTTPSGYIEFGPANTTHAHIYTDRPDFYFNKSILVNGTTLTGAPTGGEGITVSSNTVSVTNATIGSGVDLNTYRTTGFYLQDSNAKASSGSNYPTPNAGILEVYNRGVFTLQRYKRYNNSEDYSRMYYNGTWYAWTDLSSSTGAYLPLTGGTVTGNITAPNFVLSSDIRLKKDFLPLESKRLNPRRWTWKNSEEKDFGFIAQELEVDFPEIVVTDKNGFKKIAYNKITAINSSKINQLEDENKLLKNEIKDLKEKIELIMKSMNI